MAVRSSTHQAGGVVLEKLVNLDGGGYRGPRIDCGQGHLAEFVDYRSKSVITVLTPIQIRRAYYHCSACERGVIPKDKELDIVKTSCSPGVRRLMGHVGGKEAFEEGRQDLEELAGILVKTKQVERVSERLGEQIEVAAAAERKCALGGKLLPFASVPTMYIAIDGTGVPVVPRETIGRAGKDETGRAKTREVKLGCVFTQTSVDSKGRPLREESTTYVGAIETPETLASAFTRSPPRTAPCRESLSLVTVHAWIWNLAVEHVLCARYWTSRSRRRFTEPAPKKPQMGRDEDWRRNVKPSDTRRADPVGRFRGLSDDPEGRGGVGRDRGNR